MLLSVSLNNLFSIILNIFLKKGLIYESFFLYITDITVPKISDLFKNEDCSSLIYVADVFFTVGTETNGGN